jgi:chromate transporter
MEAESLSPTLPQRGNVTEVFLTFLKLGLTSFGGPVAHIGYFRREFVERRRWLSEATFIDLLGLCQFLPGPASSQLGFSIGLIRSGWFGAAAAWAGFTFPSVLLMLAFAILAPDLAGPLGHGLTHGLKLVAVIIVSQAVWDMARTLCSDHRRAAVALVATVILGVLTTVYAQLLVIAAGATLGLLICRAPARGGVRGSFEMRVTISTRSVGLLALTVFGILFVCAARLNTGHHGLAARMFNVFYRSGALVFGGGHVVLPLLQQQTVATGWVPADEFLAGYGAAQMMPGPLFSFAGYLGWIMGGVQGHWGWALLATVAIFLPGLLLVVAALPFWQQLRRRPSIGAMLGGVNASVVALLATALYPPVWTSAVATGIDFAIASVGVVLLIRWRLASLYIVVGCACAGMIESVCR